MRHEEDRNHAGLLTDVAIGARFMLRCNVCTEDGLVHGAMGSGVGYD